MRILDSPDESEDLNDMEVNDIITGNGKAPGIFY